MFKVAPYFGTVVAPSETILPYTKEKKNKKESPSPH
jgi:hypothetical protein